ncbi:MAG: flagellar basal body-associated FliL family protein [Burkholderiaceae bacterium]|uniref:Flagellar protein FliL n=1 Tax=Rubrivivax albus TaxID=2499835 RepID=A0A437JPY8_9BURK|nr:flagellar basal body-associated FliL family protein [Rubrivivax albus]MCB1995573.1 flagellar basal body-associated FliL family protein [Rhodoferax sp.]MCP5272386.1 flagellar basal body-associated FliL family protein [Burkholderiaceae bacterium]RVT48856.1 flagellar basal body rod protein [Rubrivivax albus]
MSAAAATADAPAPKGKKKLLIIIIAAVVVLALAGVGAVLMLKKSPAEHEDADDGHAKPAVAKARDPKAAPVFAPLEPFTVNLADKEAERYAQVGITLELVDSSTEGALKTFMPAVRNNILMLLAHKTSAELMERDGKEKLAREVAREAARGLGIELEDEEDEEEDTSSKRKKRKRAPAQELPITAVYFSTFIIQ